MKIARSLLVLAWNRLRAKRCRASIVDRGIFVGGRMVLFKVDQVEAVVTRLQLGDSHTMARIMTAKILKGVKRDGVAP